MNKKCSICEKTKKHYAKGKCKNCYWKEYCQKPEAKVKDAARHKKYRKKPEVQFRRSVLRVTDPRAKWRRLENFAHYNEINKKRRP